MDLSITVGIRVPSDVNTTFDGSTYPVRSLPFFPEQNATTDLIWDQSRYLQDNGTQLKMYTTLFVREIFFNMFFSRQRLMTKWESSALMGNFASKGQKRFQ